jgi:hypothetical protein
VHDALGRIVLERDAMNGAVTHYGHDGDAAASVEAARRAEVEQVYIHC